MTTGHLNPGYRALVSSLQSAKKNPTGARTHASINKNELDEIKAHAKSVWSVKDESQTTYGFYFDAPKRVEQPPVRPTSPTRLNNPHPKE